MTTTPANQADELLRLRRLRARLKRATTKLEDFARRLEALHADRSGVFRMMYPGVPLIPAEWAVVERSVRRNMSEASKGCPLCIVWLNQMAETRARIETMRNTRLPERAANYDGAWVFPEDAFRAGKRRRVSSARQRTIDQMLQSTVDYVEACRQAKLERSRARYAEFISGQEVATLVAPDRRV